MPAAPARPLRVVFFDAGNTLLSMNYPEIAAALAHLGPRVAPAEIERAEWRARVRLDAELFAPDRPRSTENRSTGERYVELILETLGIADPAIARALEDWRLAYNPPVGLWNLASPEAAAALTAVRRAGLRGAVISNSNGSAHSILEALGLTAELDFVIDSYEVGVEKPDPRIFRLALDRAGVVAAEAAYIGDLYSVDVLGARAAGLTAVLLDPGGHWGPRDCPTAPSVLDAVRLLLDGRLTPPAGSPRGSG